MTAIGSAASGRRAAFARVGRHPHMRRALLAYFAFSSVEFAVWVVVLVYAYAGGGATAVGVVAFVQLVPSALLAPSLASLVDRLPRSVAPVVAYGSVTVTIVVMAWAMLVDAPFLFVIGVAVTTNVLIGQCRPAHHSLTPSLAGGPSELVAANVVATASEGLGLFAGPALVGMLMVAGSPGVALVACAVLLAIATLLVAGIPGAAVPTLSDDQHVDPGVLKGIRQLRDDSPSRLPLLVGGAQGVVEGAVDVLVVLLAIDVLGIGDGGAGLLTSVVGVGAVVGGLSASVLVGRSRLAPSLLIGSLMTGGAMILLAVAPVAALFLAVMGIGQSVTSVGTRTILQRLSPLGVMGRMFGLLEAVSLVGLAIGSLAAPLLSNRVGVEVAFAVFGLVMPTALAAVWSRLREADASVSVPTEIIATLQGIDLLAGLEPEALEVLSRGAEVRAVTPGTTLISEGASGDEMFVVGTGTVSVSRQGDEIAVLGPGNIFGEIALLTDTPRIATVTAIDPTTLVVVNREAFLGALVTDTATRLAIEQLAASRRSETMGDSP